MESGRKSELFLSTPPFPQRKTWNVDPERPREEDLGGGRSHQVGGGKSRVWKWARRNQDEES